MSPDAKITRNTLIPLSALIATIVAVAAGTAWAMRFENKMDRMVEDRWRRTDMILWALHENAKNPDLNLTVPERPLR